MIVSIDKIQLNPSNPRFIRDSQYTKLLKSIKDFPEMMDIRPLVCFTDNGMYTILGGNMRFRAAKELGYKELKIVLADNLTESQRDEFLIKDNLGFGDWNYDQLANEWDSEKLIEWGMDLPGFDLPSEDQLDKPKKPTMNITFESPEQLQQAEIEIAELLDRKFKGATFKVNSI